VISFCISLVACSVAGPNSGLQPQPGRMASARAASALYVAYSGQVSSSGIVPPAIAVYQLGKTSPVATITDGIYSVSALTFDSAGSLYVASVSDATGASSISVYAPGSTSPQQTIRKGVSGPVAMVFDSSGNLYVANASGHRSFISVYGENGATPVRTITRGVLEPLALACDAAGRLIVANGGDRHSAPSVTIYAAGRSAPMQTVTKGVYDPAALALDTAGNLYVANPHLHGHPTITVYSGKKRWALQRTIQEPPQAIPGTIALTLDSSGQLYALLSYARTIRVYAPAATTPSLEIHARISDSAVMLTLDPLRNLYVSSGNDVLVYAPGKTLPMRKIKRGYTPPGLLAFGPY
jgi:hypothetical protein